VKIGQLDKNRRTCGLLHIATGTVDITGLYVTLESRTSVLLLVLDPGRSERGYMPSPGACVCGGTTELYVLCWSELSRRKLSPTLATADYSCSDNTVRLVAQCELSGCDHWSSFWRQLGGNFPIDLATLPQLEQ